MNLIFYKYHGAGNDFLLFNNLDSKLSFTKEQISFLCHRNFGVGADGLMLLNSHIDFDFEMNYFNSDGSGATMCGNGGRCIVAFAKKLGIISEKTKFIASDGLHEAVINSNNFVELKMNDVSGIDKINDDYFCFTGSPHYIKFVENIEMVDVYTEGRAIRYSEKFKLEGTNVNFVQIEENELLIRTYERGVENETLACGTGITASALVYSNFKNESINEFNFTAKGGKLKVSFEKENFNFKNIWLKGLAEFVFEGKIEI